MGVHHYVIKAVGSCTMDSLLILAGSRMVTIPFGFSFQTSS